MAVTQQDLHTRFGPIEPSADKTIVKQRIRDMFLQFSASLNALIPTSQQASLALSNLQIAELMALDSIDRHGTV